MKRDLLAWYAANGRDLPWRRTRDPYPILVSEVMLQQTQVPRVVPRYLEWLERWPTVEALAAAPRADVIRAWQGLGYNRRAVNLHRAAQRVAADGWPEDLTELPGIGPYTAGAVASFAYEKPVPAVDTNVSRVLRRVFLGTNGRGSTYIRRIWALASRLVPKNGKRAWKFNQAVMELGALICVARRPRCAVCPVRTVCTYVLTPRPR